MDEGPYSAGPVLVHLPQAPAITHPIPVGGSDTESEGGVGWMQVGTPPEDQSPSAPWPLGEGTGSPLLSEGLEGLGLCGVAVIPGGVPAPAGAAAAHPARSLVQIREVGASKKGRFQVGVFLCVFVCCGGWGPRMPLLLHVHVWCVWCVPDSAHSNPLFLCNVDPTLPLFPVGERVCARSSDPPGCRPRLPFLIRPFCQECSPYDQSATWRVTFRLASFLRAQLSHGFVFSTGAAESPWEPGQWQVWCGRRCEALWQHGPAAGGGRWWPW